MGLNGVENGEWVGIERRTRKRMNRRREWKKMTIRKRDEMCREYIKTYYISNENGLFCDEPLLLLLLLEPNEN